MWPGFIGGYTGIMGYLGFRVLGFTERTLLKLDFANPMLSHTPGARRKCLAP